MHKNDLLLDRDLFGLDRSNFKKIQQILQLKKTPSKIKIGIRDTNRRINQHRTKKQWFFLGDRLFENTQLGEE